MIDVGGVCYEACKMPETERDILDWFRKHGCLSTAMLEKVHAMPKQGVSSTFKFGVGYGGLRMALTAMAIPFDEVTPQRWQKEMGCLTGGDKNISKRKAEDLFPNIRITHAIADALLIAEYARRIHVQGRTR